MKPAYSTLLSLVVIAMTSSGASAFNLDLPSECGPSYYFGDGYCDASMNRGICLWDGGDCCESTCLPNREFDCGYAGYHCLHDGPPDDCTPTSYFGDGWCDPALNTLHCLYDGGDCCEHTCDEDAAFPCGQRAPYDCQLPSPDCPKPNSFRNGACNPELNTEACRYDGGDCCESTCQDGLSRVCGSNGYACHDNADRCPESMRRPDDVAAYFASTPSSPSPGATGNDSPAPIALQAVAPDEAATSGDLGRAVDYQRPFDTLEWDLVPVWSQAQIDEVFAHVRDHRDTWFVQEQSPNFGRRIPWLDPRLECESRANAVAHHVLCDFIDLEMPWKLFAIGDLKIKSSNLMNGVSTWQFHVAVAVRVGDENHAEPYVIDPAVDSTRPLPAHEWAERINDDDNDINFAVCETEAYTHTIGRCRPDQRNDEMLAWPTVLENLRVALAREWSALKELARDPAIDNRLIDKPFSLGELGNNPPWKHCSDPEMWACIDARDDDGSSYEVELHGMNATMEYRYDSTIIVLDDEQHQPMGTNCRRFTLDTMRDWRVFEVEVSGTDPSNVTQAHVYYACDDFERYEDHFYAHTTRTDTRRFHQHLVRNTNPEDSVWTVPGRDPLEYLVVERFDFHDDGDFEFKPNFFFEGDSDDAPPQRYSNGFKVDVADIEHAAVGALQIRLGNRYTLDDDGDTVRDNDDYDDISGAWEESFYFDHETVDQSRVVISFRYKLTHGRHYESNESTELRVKFQSREDPSAPVYEFRGDDIAKLAGNGEGGVDHTTDWQHFSFEADMASDEFYSLAIGILNNRRTYYNEEAYLWIDDVVVARVP